LNVPSARKTPRDYADGAVADRPPLCRMLSSKAAAQACGYAESTFRKMRVRGDGPVFTLAGTRKILYRLDDIDAWLLSRPRFTSTSERAAMARSASRAAT